MKLPIITAIAILTNIAIAGASRGENLSDLTQLLNTKQCQQCELSNAGLVQANLIGADLTQANLVGANLSQANLTGANLRGANLTGASLNGANLTGANLTGINLSGTDLRNAYLGNANLTEVNLDTALVDGIKGIDETAATAEQFHRWGVREAELGNYNAAVAHYNKAIKIDPEFAAAYLGLGIIQYNFDRRLEAKENTKIAAKLFEEQEHEVGHQTAIAFETRMTQIEEAEAKMEKKEGGLGHVGKFMGSVGSLLLQLLVK